MSQRATRVRYGLESRQRDDIEMVSSVLASIYHTNCELSENLTTVRSTELEDGYPERTDELVTNIFKHLTGSDTLEYHDVETIVTEVHMEKPDENAIRDAKEELETLGKEYSILYTILRQISDDYPYIGKKVRGLSRDVDVAKYALSNMITDDDELFGDCGCESFTASGNAEFCPYCGEELD